MTDKWFKWNIRSVPIRQMQPVPFAHPPNPRQVDAIAARLDLDKLGYPVVNLRDGVAWIIDGQARIAALRKNGMDELLCECKTFEGLTDTEMAKVFFNLDGSLRDRGI